jgi:hypothetical protein
MMIMLARPILAILPMDANIPMSFVTIITHVLKMSAVHLKVVNTLLLYAMIMIFARTTVVAK